MLFPKLEYLDLFHGWFELPITAIILEIPNLASVFWKSLFVFIASCMSLDVRDSVEQSQKVREVQPHYFSSTEHRFSRGFEFGVEDLPPT